MASATVTFFGETCRQAGMSEKETNYMRYFNAELASIGSHGQNNLIIVPIGNIHNVYSLFNGNALFCP